VQYLIRIVIVTPAAYTLRPVVQRQHGPADYQRRLGRVLALRFDRCT
jgi:hypothetical protein